MTLSGQHFMVLGLGKSGLGSAALLRRHGAEVTGVDRKPVEVSDISFNLETAASLLGIDALVVSPGVPLTHPLIQQAHHRGTKVLGEIELAYLFLRGPIIAITGSNGKTTTTALTGHILRNSNIDCQVGGNIGIAATEMTESSAFRKWNVLEISSFQLETVDRFHADVASVLNVTANHLDRHFTMEEYVRLKGRVFRNQRYSDWALLNSDNPVSAAYETTGEKVFFAAPNGEAIELFGKKLMSVFDLPLLGRHNLENTVAAATIASLAGANHEDIAQAIVSFKGVPHRLEFIREVSGVKYYNDSKATSVDASLKALEALDGPLWVILGGQGKGASYLPLLPLLQQKAKGALLIGKEAPSIEKQFRGLLPLEISGNLDRAMSFASGHAVAGDTVLLAPACASYDQFQSYEHRGDTFRRLVEAL